MFSQTCHVTPISKQQLGAVGQGLNKSWIYDKIINYINYTQQMGILSSLVVKMLHYIHRLVADFFSLLFRTAARSKADESTVLQ